MQNSPSLGAIHLTHFFARFFQALWLINEKNETLKALELSNNQVGAKAEDSTGLARMLMTSTALVHLNLSENVLGSLGTNLKAFGREGQ